VQAVHVASTGMSESHFVTRKAGFFIGFSLPVLESFDFFVTFFFFVIEGNEISSRLHG
jgi:hypothetical protein